ncbi:hypothetical protein BGZ52_004335 [Haplosporangium bisporale]|nr:hypothetical protein BGZ52_004335 [Haplosporangium bisporale]KFH71159.1 hypothetical protein MVEG_04005 [Podila verticillata NRRL 6337]
MLFKHLTSVVALLALVTPHVTAHMALLYPKPRGFPGTKDSKGGEVHAWIGFKGVGPKHVLPCNGYPYDPKNTTPLEAGDVVDVRFWGPALGEHYMNNLPAKPGPHRPQLSQARHGGGRCQFSLSADGGETFHLIGEYTHSCPDVYYKWSVKIPENVPDCNEPGKCLFVWSWTAANIDQFYQNCADVTIKGKKGGEYPKKGIATVDIPGDNKYPKNIRMPGDGFGNDMGEGPNPHEMNKNLHDEWN